MWGLDLGTTNSVLARWHVGDGRPRLVAPGPLRRSGPEDALQLVPSAVELVDDVSLLDRLAAHRFLLSRATFGKLGWIGGEALARNYPTPRTSFAPGFKTALMRAPLTTLVRADGRDRSAREVARVFLRELILAAEKEAGESIESLVVTTPVEAYETYRAEVAGLLREVGVPEVRFLDEPVAAALGYGVGSDISGALLVVDFGGGTLHAAVVDLSSLTMGAGGCRVVSKSGRALGGDTVDGWLKDLAVERLGIDVEHAPDWLRPFWDRLLIREATRVKEALSTQEHDTFRVPIAQDLQFGVHGPPSFEFGRSDLVALLARHGLPTLLDEVLDDALRGVDTASIGAVVVVGGSSQLPGFREQLEARFGRARLRAWSPFEAVGYGAACFAAGRIQTADYIVHDYALRTHHVHAHTAEYTVVVPKGTTFPTAPDFWRHSLVPTCAHGLPEALFQLVIYELGRDGAVALNGTSPTIGGLQPPHQPGDTRPRLDLALGVDAERWLCATARDLQTGRVLLEGKPIVQLL